MENAKDFTELNNIIFKNKQ